MVQANDGGANVSYDGGRTWSTQENQPTAEFYGVEIDKKFPYNLYAEQLFEASSNGNVFPEAALLHNVDKPFEQHRWMPDEDA